MNARPHLAPGMYGYDDITTGDFLDTGIAQITAELIDRFADLSGDRFEIHMSRQGAEAHGFPDRVAHGLLVLSVVDGLKNTAPAQLRAVASLGWTWSFRAPVISGDAIKARITVLGKRQTKNPDRGIVKLGFMVTNQHGETVQDGHNQLMVYR